MTQRLIPLRVHAWACADVLYSTYILSSISVLVQSAVRSVARCAEHRVHDDPRHIEGRIQK